MTANWERERIGEQWKVAQSNAVGRGIHVSGYVPPGYKRLGRSADPSLDRKLVPDPTHGRTITEAYAMAAHGESYASVASFLTESKFPSGGNAGNWAPNRIRRLLSNRVYRGQARYGSIVNPDAHEPLVDELTWNLAQRVPTGPTISNQKTQMLAGFCRCASCSFSMRAQKSKADPLGSYRCRTNSPAGRCDHPATIGRDRIENFVIEQFLARVADVTLQQSDEEDETSGQSSWPSRPSAVIGRL